jgi:RNA polymerase sigma factor (sigma-70 family)
MVKEQTRQDEFLLLYEPVQQRISNYCRVITCNNEHAKDLLSETILLAYSNFDKIHNKELFIYYLFGTASRLFKKYLKRKKDLNNYLNLLLIERNEEPRWDELDFLYFLLDQLPPEQKQTIILFEINGFSIKEITKIQGISESAVKSRLKRGREKLSIILKKIELSNEKLKVVSYGSI